MSTLWILLVVWAGFCVGWVAGAWWKATSLDRNADWER